MINGFVSLVGAGLGDFDLLTTKAVSCIKAADVIIYDALISSSILNMAGLDAELIYVGKRAGQNYTPQQEISNLIVCKAKQGKYVVRLKGGDPLVFGRIGEELEALKLNNIDYEIVPGISSAVAAPAYAGIVLTHRDYASDLHIITGTESDKKTAHHLNYEVISKLDGSICVLMFLKNANKIAKKLINNGMAAKTPVSIIANGSMVSQKRYDFLLEDLTTSKIENVKESLAMLVIGKACTVNFDWFLKKIKNKKLFAKKILSTGTRSFVNNIAPFIKDEGAEPILLSLIESVPNYAHLKDVERSISQSNQSKKDNYNWLVFTSANGVKFFFEYLKNSQLIDFRSIASKKIAVIGSETATALKAYGIKADFIPSAYTSDALAQEWIPLLTSTDRVLLLRAEEASSVLPEKLASNGIEYLNKPIYKTIIDYRRKDELLRLINDVDYITFASSSAVLAFYELTQNIDIGKIHGKLVSIGPVTTETALKFGFKIDIEATKYTAKGLVEGIKSF